MKWTPRSKRLEARPRELEHNTAPVIENLERRMMLSTHRHGTLANVGLITGGITREGGSITTGYSPAQIRALYQLNKLDTFNRNFPLYINKGDFQTIVVIGAATPQLNDRIAPMPNPRKSNLNQFSDAAGIHDQPVLEDPIVSPTDPTFNPLDPNFVYTDLQGAEETTMQLEWAHAMAPFADLICVEVPSTNGVVAPADLELGIEKATQDLQQQFPGPINGQLPGGVVVMGLSTNGESASEAAMFDSLFSYKYAANVSFIAPAGDIGGVPSMPATSPFVTSVGATVVQLTTAGGRISETASLNSGGGVSTVESLPAFQRGITANGVPLTTRSGPDVALAGSVQGEGMSYFFDPTDKNNAPLKWFTYDGTEVSAAIFAGMVADVNEMRLKAGLGTIGRDLNSEMYAAFKSNPKANFTDITEGSNTLYPAVKGFDLATGMGAPDAYNLIPALAGITPHVHKVQNVTTQVTSFKVKADQYAALSSAANGNVVTPFAGTGTATFGSTTVTIALTATSLTSVTTTDAMGNTITANLLATLPATVLTINKVNSTVSGRGTITVTGIGTQTFTVGITGTIRSRNGVSHVSATIFTVDSRGKRIAVGPQPVFQGDFSF